MPNKERRDIQTRFKKGQSGNPSGRPKNRKTNAAIVKDVLLKPIRINEGGQSRTVPKIQAAFEVCINKALKGDIRAFVKILEIAERLNLLRLEPEEEEITEIRRILVYPNGSERDI